MIDDQLIKLVHEMASQHSGATMAMLCELLVNIAESSDENSGYNKGDRLEFECAGRLITIHKNT